MEMGNDLLRAEFGPKPAGTGVAVAYATCAKGMLAAGRVFAPFEGVPVRQAFAPVRNSDRVPTKALWPSPAGAQASSQRSSDRSAISASDGDRWKSTLMARCLVRR